MSSEDELGDEAIRVLIRVVLPLGSSVLAAVELVDGAAPLVELGFVGILAGGIFLAFRNSIAMLDGRLNSEVPR